MRIDLTCAECGGNSFALIEIERDDTPITCCDCGHAIGTLAELKDQVADQVISRSSNQPKAA